MFQHFMKDSEHGSICLKEIKQLDNQRQRKSAPEAQRAERSSLSTGLHWSWNVDLLII